MQNKKLLKLIKVKVLVIRNRFFKTIRIKNEFIDGLSSRNVKYSIL